MIRETAPSEEDNRKAFDLKSKVQPSETSFEKIQLRTPKKKLHFSVFIAFVNVHHIYS